MSAPAGIHGQAVLLRALTQADAETLRGFVNDPEVMQYSNSYSPVHQGQQLRWMDSALSHAGATWFGICDAQAEGFPLIGTCCLVDFDPVVRSAELRIRIGHRPSWGRKLGREACQLLLRYGFDDRNLERIWLRVFSNNIRAIGLYQQLGFRPEGLLRRAAYLKGQWQDVHLMALLRHEWQSVDQA